MVDIIWHWWQEEAACQGEHSLQVSPTMRWQPAVPGTNPMFCFVGLLSGHHWDRATQECFREPLRVHGNQGIPSSSGQGRLCYNWKHFLKVCGIRHSKKKIHSREVRLCFSGICLHLLANLNLFKIPCFTEETAKFLASISMIEMTASAENCFRLYRIL